MNNPKDKAKELVDKYQYLVPTWDCYNDCDLEIEYRLPGMKQCALIAVDEILDVIDRDMNYQNVYSYFLEVKQEIEKL